MAAEGAEPVEAEPAEIKPKRPRIKLPNGEELTPRLEMAADELRISEKTLKRMDPPTTYIGGVAYVARNATLQLIADRLKRRSEEPKRRRRRG